MALDQMDESGWIHRFVSAGLGTEAEARLLYAKKTPAPDGAADSAQSPPKGETAPAGQQEALTDDLFGDFAPAPTIQKSPASPKAKQKKAEKKPVGRPPKDWKGRDKTQRELDLFNLSLEIEQRNVRDSDSLGFMATAMIYASLPHSEVDGGIFKRKNNDLSLTIMNDPDIGLPYGKIPRIITAFLCTEAKRQELSDAPEVIKLGRSQAEFIKKLGITTGGGPRGGVTYFKDQATRLFTSRISLIGQPDSQFHFQNLDIASKGMILWNPHHPDEKQAWNSELTLSSEFHKECISHSVPLDMRVLHKLRSPLAIDIYIWLTYRYNAIKHPTPVSWKQLKWQFGANYADDAQGMHNFKSNFKIHLKNVSLIYTEAKFAVDRQKLTLFPSLTHILPPPAKES